MVREPSPIPERRESGDQVLHSFTLAEPDEIMGRLGSEIYTIPFEPPSTRSQAVGGGAGWRPAGSTSWPLNTPDG